MESSRWLKTGLYDLVRIRDSYEDRSNMFRMDRNERTWPVPESILDEIQKNINSDILTNYTEIESTYDRLARYLGVGYGQLYLHSGSDLVIKSIFEAFVDKGDRILMQNPSYAMYGVYARMYGADFEVQDFDATLRFNLDDYCTRVEDSSPKMVVLENPGGYFGNSFSHEAIEKLIVAASKCDTLVIVDEAYIDYIPESSVIDLVNKYDNLIVVRTFSKAWGLAGLRAGYAVSSDLLISDLFRVRPMHELTSFTAMVVETMLDHADGMEAYVDEVKHVRDYFNCELEKLQIRYVKSDAHFVTACIGERTNADVFREEALKHRFYVRRPFAQKEFDQWIRIGLLPMSEMEEFVDFLQLFITR